MQLYATPQCAGPLLHLLHQASAICHPHYHALPAAVHMSRGSAWLWSSHEQLSAPQLDDLAWAVVAGDVEAAAMLQHNLGDLGAGRMGVHREL